MIISNEEMEDIMEIVKSLEESGLLIKVVSEIQESGFLSMLLGTLGVSLLEDLLVDKSVIRAGGAVIRVV